jgi:hypothetical protein
MQSVTGGCLCRRRVVPVMDAFFPSPFLPLFFFILLLLFFFLFVQELIRGHYPSVVTSGGSVTHKYFHRNERLARDETPFPLAMQPRVTALAW